MSHFLNPISVDYPDFLSSDQPEAQPENQFKDQPELLTEAQPETISAPISSEQPGQVVQRTLPSNARLTSIDDILPPAERIVSSVSAHIATYKKENKKISDVFKAENLPRLQAAQIPVERFLRICKTSKAPEYGQTKALSDALKEHIATLQQ